MSHSPGAQLDIDDGKKGAGAADAAAGTASESAPVAAIIAAVLPKALRVNIGFPFLEPGFACSSLRIRIT
ncbi:hypothetical protein [Rhodococcus kronopolitis]|uniref:hypothetical protein n=1 Tax=Rhodococcus kronopolitis TaxID=1460226 RepID=UPI00366BA2A0